MKTAMQELRNDLVKAKEKSITALNDINNEILRKTCQEAVKLTIESIIERIDDKLLEMEKQQMCQFAFDYQDEFFNNGKVAPIEQYYTETFKNTNK
jgi:hypothetical protein